MPDLQTSLFVQSLRTLTAAGLFLIRHYLLNKPGPQRLSSIFLRFRSDLLLRVRLFGRLSGDDLCDLIQEICRRPAFDQDKISLPGRR